MPGYLYIISESPNGPVKIGRSISPGSRLATLQTGNPRPLRIYASYLLPDDDVVMAEEHLHHELEHRAMVGEWFDLPENFMAGYMPDFFLSLGLEPIR
jgi:hypothetical protein